MDNHQHEELNPKSTSPETFVPPRHWIGPEELEASYWQDAQAQEKRGQEFYEKPVEYLDQVEKLGKGGLARREFLTVMGASMAMASFSCARRPVHKIIPYVVRPEEITLGVPNWYASTCKECGAGCGILAKTREGRPIKLEGNPDHPVNQGRLCARCQASILGLYDPDRMKAPVSRGRAAGGSTEITWPQADAKIQEQLKSIAAGAGQVRIFSETLQSDATRALVQDFLSGFKKGGLVEFDPLSLEEISHAQALSYGVAVIPRYRFDLSQYTVSFGADFLGTWLSPVEHAQAWSKGRKLNNPEEAPGAKLSKLVCFEPMMSLTGSNSDERYPIRPGDEVKVALALANELIVTQKFSRFAQNPRIVSALSSYSPEAISTEIGLVNGAALFKKLAIELWQNRGKSLVVGGGLQSKTAQAMTLQVVVNFLNTVLENEGVTVDGTASGQSPQGGFSQVSQLIAEMKAGQVDALILYRTNPAYHLPRLRSEFEAALKRVRLVILVSDREDETASWADYVLPDHHFLENWGDATARRGVYSLQQPVLAPIHSTRAFEDSLLVWAKAVGLKVSSRATQSESWHHYLQGYWRETHYTNAGAAGSFETFWEGVLRRGIYLTSRTPSLPTPRAWKEDSLAGLPQYVPTGAGAKETLYLSLYSKISMGDGKSANNAWLQEMPDPISSITWDNYLNIGPDLAKKLGFKNDDVVEMVSGEVRAQLPVHIQPGLHPSVVTAAVGYGRRAVGKVGNQAGVDVYPFVTVENNRLVYSGQTITLSKTGKFYRLASTQWHTATEERPVINDITLDQYRKSAKAATHTNPHLRLEKVPSMWPVHEYTGYRWGMTIDLNSCTGCSACVIACQAENNVPVVGRDQVRNSRQMHWIRIDRYYSGNPANPDVIFQPMLCQHCENAPCETVCPVLATVHDDEGLNVQVYNRCVGTRYCQNNCPYKVRRFNFFDHWKSYEAPMNMVWNPDVTVRTRGIMEKCTFCTQRIRDAKDKAKDLGVRVHDKDLKTACQQTCPTDAISFGDINNPDAQVSTLRSGPRAFSVLEVLNTKPSISYLTKVRNKVAVAHAGHAAHPNQEAHHE